MCMSTSKLIRIMFKGSRMRHITHILFSILIIVGIYEMYPSLKLYIPFVYATVLAPIGALVPDLDHPHSYISQNWKFLSVVIRKTTPHRGWTHSLIGGAFFTVALGGMFWYAHASTLNTIPFFVGYVSHLLSDSLNPTGVNWLWPKSRKKYSICSIRTGSHEEKIFQGIVSFGIVGLFVYDVMFNAGSLLS